MTQVHRVKRGPRAVPSVLPKDQYRAGTFVEADGTVMEVAFSGKHMPQTKIIRDGPGSWRKVGHPVATTT